MFGVNVPATYAGVDECGYGKLTVACNAQWVVDEAILGKITCITQATAAIGKDVE